MRSPNIVVIDYQAGNLRSVQKAFEYAGTYPRITDNPHEIEHADALVFPGQGSNDSSMHHLKTRGLIDPIKEFIESGKPFLGVCLGLELLLESSEEGVEPGLGVFGGKVKRFPPNGLKIPHIGWNQVYFRLEHPLLKGIPNGSYFYFVHSYYADPEDKKMVVGTTNYGVEFCSAAAINNLFAVQFHPEKSGDLGLRIYRNFVSLVEASITENSWK